MVKPLLFRLLLPIFAFFCTLWSITFSDAQQAPPASGGDPAAAATIVAKLKRAYEGKCCFQGDFDQLTVNVSMDMKDHFTGVMYVKKPNLISMEVETPERQKLVMTGVEYIVFFPADGAVAQGRIPPDMNLEHFFSFLADMSNVDEHFNATVPAPNPERPSELLFLELAQKGKPQSSYRILLGLDPQRFIVRRAVVYDALGNYNRFDLTNLTFPDDIPDSRFKIEGRDRGAEEAGSIPFLDETHSE